MHVSPDAAVCTPWNDRRAAAGERVGHVTSRAASLAEAHRALDGAYNLYGTTIALLRALEAACRRGTELPLDLMANAAGYLRRRGEAGLALRRQRAESAAAGAGPLRIAWGSSSAVLASTTKRKKDGHARVLSSTHYDRAR